jgi:hypothetical protein
MSIVGYCAVCLCTDKLVSPACSTCHIKLCFNCRCNDCKGLCPVCDREALNEAMTCIDCEQSFHLKDGFMCAGCHDMVCYTCFGDFTHKCTEEEIDEGRKLDCRAIE